MRPIAKLTAVVAAAASAAAYMSSATGQADGDAAPIYGVKIPPGYRDWRLVAVKQLTGAEGKLKQLHAQLGNDLAIDAFREGSFRFRTAQSLRPSIGMKPRQTQTTKSLPPAFFAGSAVNVQFIVEDSKQYPCTKSVSPATCLQKITTTFSRITRLRPDRRAPLEGNRHVKICERRHNRGCPRAQRSGRNFAGSAQGTRER